MMNINEIRTMFAGKCSFNERRYNTVKVEDGRVTLTCCSGSGLTTKEIYSRLGITENEKGEVKE